MNEQVKSNLHPENKGMHMVRMYRKRKREQTMFTSQMHEPVRSNLPHTART